MPLRISPPAYLSHFSQYLSDTRIEHIYPAFTLYTGTLLQWILLISTTLKVA